MRLQTLSWAVDREREQTSWKSCELSLEQLLCYPNGNMPSGFDLGLYHETPSAEINHSGLKIEDRLNLIMCQLKPNQSK